MLKIVKLIKYNKINHDQQNNFDKWLCGTAEKEEVEDVRGSFSAESQKQPHSDKIYRWNLNLTLLPVEVSQHCVKFSKCLLHSKLLWFIHSTETTVAFSIPEHISLTPHASRLARRRSPAGPVHHFTPHLHHIHVTAENSDLELMWNSHALWLLLPVRRSLFLLLVFLSSVSLMVYGLNGMLFLDSWHCFTHIAHMHVCSSWCHWRSHVGFEAANSIWPSGAETKYSWCDLQVGTQCCESPWRDLRPHADSSLSSCVSRGTFKSLFQAGHTQHLWLHLSVKVMVCYVNVPHRHSCICLLVRGREQWRCWVETNDMKDEGFFILEQNFQKINKRKCKWMNPYIHHCYASFSNWVHGKQLVLRILQSGAI